jgi:site-specific recombinase XerD
MNAIMVRCFQQLLSRRTTEKFVFLNSNGKQLRGPRDWFGEALNRSRIAGYHWHDNRHTFCSRLVLAGVDIRTVAALAGHATIQMTMRYAHLSPDHNRAAVDKLMQFSLKQSDTKSDTSKGRSEKSAVKY